MLLRDIIHFDYMKTEVYHYKNNYYVVLYHGDGENEVFDATAFFAHKEVSIDSQRDWYEEKYKGYKECLQRDYGKLNDLDFVKKHDSIHPGQVLKRQMVDVLSSIGNVGIFKPIKLGKKEDLDQSVFKSPYLKYIFN